MQVSQIALPIDDTLTPQNAPERGYRWVCNVAYEETEVIPPDLLQNYLNLINDGYKLGCALHPITDLDKGLYEPVSL